jgi:asparagine synthase (glutamine-hydrolysing)
VSTIFGVVSFGGAPVGSPELTAMDAALAGDRIGGTYWSDGTAAVGCMVQDFTVEDAHERQPLHDRGQNLVLVADGRLDNRAELGATLGLRADGGVPDSTLLLAAFERWGEACLDHVAGELALAVWSRRAQQLFLGCSAPLSRPLLYVWDGRRLAFATHPRGLFAIAGFQRRIDEDAITALVLGQRRDQTGTVFRDVRRLPPGMHLTAERSGTRIKHWWRPDLRRRLRLRSESDYVEALDDVLGRVVASQLRRNGPIGVMLSGGLDSGALAVLAAERLAADGEMLACYTEVPPPGFSAAVPPGRYADETPYVTALARMHPNLSLRFVTGHQRGLLDCIEDYFDACETPFRNAANRPWMEAIHERAAADGVRVLLAGDHGNVTASWSGDGLLVELLRAGRVVRAARESRAWARVGRSPTPWRAFAGHGVLPLLPPTAQRAIVATADRRRLGPDPRGALPFVNPELVARAAKAPSALGHVTRLRNGARGQRIEAILSSSPLMSDFAAGARLRFGVEARSPLADRRLVEFCIAVPEQQWSRADQDRILMRRAMAGRLPAASLTMRERGLQAAGWFQSMASERDRLVGETDQFAADPLTCRVLDVRAMRAALEQWPAQSSGAHAELVRLRGQLGIALMMGAFLRWAQTRA